VGTFAPAQGDSRIRERSIEMFEVFQGEISAVAGVDIEHGKTGAFPG
jgi:hypothetical protein